MVSSVVSTPPCLYYHPKRRVKALVHGDDFVSVGSKQAATAFKTKRESRFEIKTQVLCTGTPAPDAGACAPWGPKAEIGRKFVKAVCTTV